MLNFDIKKLVVPVCAAATLSFAALGANAAAIGDPCTFETTGGDTIDVSGAPYVDATQGSVDGCTLTGIDNDTSASLLDGAFGHNWTFDGKVDGAFGSAGSLTIDPNVASDTFGAAGEWEISADFFVKYTKGLLVFKDGDKALPDAVIAYLISPGGIPLAAAGTYTSMFFKEDGKPKDTGVSHVSLYGWRDPDLPGGPIPVPAALPMLLSALGVGAFVARRKRKNA